MVFKWRPYEGDTDEIITGASRLSLSRDGNLFATGNVRGTVKVCITSDFSLIYQLASEDSVLSLAFSPDLHRFYDVRGYYANAWEPNALLRFAEQGSGIDGGASEKESSAHVSTVNENWVARVDSVTVISPNGGLVVLKPGMLHLHNITLIPCGAS